MIILYIFIGFVVVAVIIASFESHKDFNQMMEKKYPITPDMDHTSIDVMMIQRAAYAKGWDDGRAFEQEEQRLKEKAWAESCAREYR